MDAGRKGPADLWGERRAPAPGETVRLEVGPLAIWLRGVENELWVTHERSPDGGGAPGSLPAHPSWSRWALPTDHKWLRVSPILPDRSLVVKPEHAFTLVSRAEARIYMRVPVWVRLEVMAAPGGPRTTLTEIPTLQLSDTWWGDFSGGELAYWFSTSGRRALSPELFEPHLVLCVVQLENRSEDDLSVEKHLLRVEHLSIFRKEGWLWAEEVQVHYHGEDEGSEILMEDLPPREAEGGEEITPARHQARTFRARTFARLRALTPWGG